MGGGGGKIVFGLGFRDQLRLLDHRLPGCPRVLPPTPSLRPQAPSSAPLPDGGAIHRQLPLAGALFTAISSGR